MKIFVSVSPNSAKGKVLKVDEHHYKVYVEASPEKGKANRRLVELLSENLNIPKQCIAISSGLTTRNKIIEILC